MGYFHLKTTLQSERFHPQIEIDSTIAEWKKQVLCLERYREAS